MTQQAAQDETMKAYRQGQADIATIIDWIQMELETHEQNAIDEDDPWACTIELGLVKDQLKRVLAELSGVEDKEIERSLQELRM